MELSELNLLAIGLAAISGFVVGGLWYGPLFGKRWMEETGMTEEKIKDSNMVLIYGTTFLLNIIVAIGLSLLLDVDSSAVEGLQIGLFIGTVFVAAAIGINYLFSQNTIALYLINAGYMITIFSVMGTILGAF